MTVFLTPSSFPPLGTYDTKETESKPIPVLYYWQDLFVSFVLHELTDYKAFCMMCVSMLRAAKNGNGLQTNDSKELIHDVWTQYPSWPKNHVADFLVHEPFFQKLIVPAKVNDNEIDRKAINVIYLMGWNNDFKVFVKNHELLNKWMLRFQQTRYKHEDLKNYVSLFSYLEEDRKHQVVTSLETINNDLKFLVKKQKVTKLQFSNAINYLNGSKETSDFPCIEFYKNGAKQYGQGSPFYLALIINLFINIEKAFDFLKGVNSK